MKILLLFFLIAACLPSAFATPAPLCNQNGDSILGIRNTDAPPAFQTPGTGQPIEETTNLSVPALAEHHPRASCNMDSGNDVAREVPHERQARGAQNHYQQTRKEDGPCATTAFVAKDNTPSVQSTLSSAAPTFNPKSAACPQSAARPALSVFQEKLSSADFYAQLLDTPRHFSVEPQILEGNRFRE